MNLLIKWGQTPLTYDSFFPYVPIPGDPTYDQMLKTLQAEKERRANRFKQLNCVLNALLSLVNGLQNGDKGFLKDWAQYVVSAADYYNSTHSSPNNWNIDGIGIGGDGFNPIIANPSIAGNTFYGDEITAIATLIHEPQHDLSQRGLGHTDKNGIDWGAKIQESLANAKIIAQQIRVRGCCDKDPNKSKRIRNKYDSIRCDCEVSYPE
jgi:hypothetical protein